MNDIFFDDDPSVAYVAHYTKAGTALRQILPNGLLQLGSIQATNDPRESSNWNFSVVGEPGQALALGRRNEEFTHIIKTGCKVLCMSCEPTGRKMKYGERCFAKARMWAQYAEDHRGLCLVFDKALLGQAIETSLASRGRLIAGPVKYWDYDVDDNPEWTAHMNTFTLYADELRQAGLEGGLIGVRDRRIETFFFRKNKDWETESEYRWIMLGEDDRPEYVQVAGALKGLVVGCDFPEERLQEVREHCERYEAHFAKALWVNGMPGFNWLSPEDLHRLPSFA